MKTLSFWTIKGCNLRTFFANLRAREPENPGSNILKIKWFILLVLSDNEICTNLFKNSLKKDFMPLMFKSFLKENSYFLKYLFHFVRFGQSYLFKFDDVRFCPIYLNFELHTCIFKNFFIFYVLFNFCYKDQVHNSIRLKSL